MTTTAAGDASSRLGQGGQQYLRSKAAEVAAAGQRRRGRHSPKLAEAATGAFPTKGVNGGGVCGSPFHIGAVGNHTWLAQD